MKRVLIAYLESLVETMIPMMRSIHLMDLGKAPLNLSVTRRISNLPKANPSIKFPVPEGHSGQIAPRINEDYSYRNGSIVVQKHIASHEHFDVSVIDKESKVELFRGAVSKRELSSLFPKTNRPTGFERQPQHSVEYATQFGKDNWEVIEEGYGKGQVRQVLNSEIAILHTDPGRISFDILEGEYKGGYSLLNTSPDSSKLEKSIAFIEGRLPPPKMGMWLFIKRTATPDIDPRHDYKSESDVIPFLQSIRNDNSVIIESKRDGNNERLLLEGGKARLFGTRPNKDGIMMEHTHHAPHIVKIDQDVKIGLDGTVLHGELYHPRSASFTSGLLNSNPLRARLTQRANGRLRIDIFDITRYKGQDVSNLPYRERKELYRNVVKELNNPFIKPIRSYSNSNALTAFELESEGLVVKDKEAGFNETKWIKVKHSATVDVPIISWFKAEPGSKYDGNAIGGIVVDHNGTAVRVGSGLTDAIRRDIYNNPEKFIGAIVEVEAMEVTPNNNLRAPRFVRFHPAKNSEIILTEYAFGAGAETEQEAENTMYAMKTSAGWRK